MYLCAEGMLQCFIKGRLTGSLTGKEDIPWTTDEKSHNIGRFLKKYRQSKRRITKKKAPRKEEWGVRTLQKQTWIRGSGKSIMRSSREPDTWRRQTAGWRKRQEIC